MRVEGNLYIAAEIGIGEVPFGFNLFTTEPPLEEFEKEFGETTNYKSVWGHNKKGTYSGGERVYTGLYLGYRNGNRVSRVGIDGPGVQDLFQNGWHKIIGSPMFNTYDGPTGSRMFTQGGYLNPYTLYPY